MTESEYVAQLHALGQPLHLHDGVWWQTTLPLYCKPAFEYRTLAVGEARPERTRSLLGFKHLVGNLASANAAKVMLGMTGAELAAFSMTSLDSAERAQVRKGQRLLKIAPIVDLEPVLEDMRLINIAQAHRTGHGLAANYYVDHAEEWRSYVRRLHALPSRVWLGAYSELQLVAYYYYYKIDGVLLIDSAKSHTDHLKKCPNSALVFELLERARAEGDVRLILYGGPSGNATLDGFKRRYGFREKTFPVYERMTMAGRLVRGVLSMSDDAGRFIERAGTSARIGRAIGGRHS